MKFYAIGEDKSLVDVTELVLSLSGGAMTGDISFKGSKATKKAIKFLDNTVNTYGNGISIGSGGIVIIGGGEAADQIEGIEAAETEKVVLASDQAIEFYTNCQNGIDSANKVTLNNGLLSGHQKKITSGQATPTGGSNGDIYIQY